MVLRQELRYIFCFYQNVLTNYCLLQKKAAFLTHLPIDNVNGACTPNPVPLYPYLLKISFSVNFTAQTRQLVERLTS